MDVHDQLVHQNQYLGKQVLEDMEKYRVLLEAAKVHKLRSERRTRIAQGWLTSDEPEASSFFGDLTSEMMNASSLISDERYRLAAAELGVDFEALQSLAKDKGDEAIQNLASILEQESAVLVNST